MIVHLMVHHYAALISKCDIPAGVDNFFCTRTRFFLNFICNLLLDFDRTKTKNVKFHRVRDTVNSQHDNEP